MSLLGDMTLFSFCKMMAEWTADYMLIPVFNFQAGLFPPFSSPAGDIQIGWGLMEGSLHWHGCML